MNITKIIINAIESIAKGIAFIIFIVMYAVMVKHIYNLWGVPYVLLMTVIVVVAYLYIKKHLRDETNRLRIESQAKPKPSMPSTSHLSPMVSPAPVPYDHFYANEPAMPQELIDIVNEEVVKAPRRMSDTLIEYAILGMGYIFFGTLPIIILYVITYLLTGGDSGALSEVTQIIMSDDYSTSNAPSHR